MKKTFMVETKWYDAISQLPEPEQLAVYKRLFLFHSEAPEEVPFTSELQKSIWSFIEDILNKRRKRTEAVDWKEDYNIYLANLQSAYNTLINDPGFIREKEKYYPNLDIKLSIEKSVQTYWSTVEGWTRKKKSGTKKLDWRKTFSNALDQRFNHVYKQKSANNPEPEKQCRWRNTRTGEIRTNTVKQYFIDKNRYGSHIIQFIEYVN